MKRQSGITLIGFVIVLIIAAFVVYTGMKLVPVYMDYFNVSKALNTVATQAQSTSSASLTVTDVQRALDTQELSQYFSDSDIQPKNITIVTNPGGGSSLKLSYDKKIPWLYNIDFLVHFEKTVPLKQQAQG